MKEVILKKKVTLEEVDKAMTKVIKDSVSQMRLAGADERNVMQFLKAQSIISVDILETLFGKAEVAANLNEQLTQQRKKMGDGKWEEFEEKARKEFERN